MVDHPRRYPEVVSRIEVCTSPSPASIKEICNFVSTLDPSQRLSDHLRLDLLAGGRQGFVGLLDRDDATGALVGYAQMSAGNDCQILGVCAAMAEPLLLASLEHRNPRLRLRWWIHDAPSQHEPLALSHGFVLERALIELRRWLPGDQRSGLTTRGIDLERDLEAVIAVNNRAFDGHGEQGNWTMQDLQRRIEEPWFRPDAIRVIDGAAGIDGFCWVKPHHDEDRPCGEIYVIGVDPQHHGRGLGTELTRAGVDWMTDHGLPEAMLFVDEQNAAALRLYQRLGFSPSRIDRCYSLEALQ